ncbi:hypothetical protein M3Y99_01423400 [Aphelenchoides fujianensis]|nr:hypothetical protein M3Y99_01423400 [Aphelenchoides fujianensis]
MSALKYTACALVVVLLLPLGVLLLGAVLSGRFGGQKVLPAEFAVWRVGGVWLEDFAAIARPQPQPAVRSLDFSVSLAGGLDGDLGQLHAFYGRCARNLRRAAPRLRWIGWNGGYVFNPENGTAQELEDELRLLHAHLAFLSATAARFGWELGAFDFHAVLVAEPAVVRAAHLAPLLRELFGRAPTAAEQRAQAATFSARLAAADVRVHLSFTNAALFRDSPHRRSPFFVPFKRLGIPPGGRHSE